MSYFKGTPGEWDVTEGWADGHVSISAPTHGALAQVVFGSEDPVNEFNAEAYARRCAVLAANVRAVVCAAEMAELLLELHAVGQTEGWNGRLEQVVYKLGNLDFTKALK